MTKYKIWTHYDTGIEQHITAKNENEAREKAEKEQDTKDFKQQLLDNSQRAEIEIIKEE